MALILALVPFALYLGVAIPALNSLNAIESVLAPELKSVANPTPINVPFTAVEAAVVQFVQSTLPGPATAVVGVALPPLTSVPAPSGGITAGPATVGTSRPRPTFRGARAD